MRTLYAALALTLVLFYMGKLPMQHARSTSVSVVTPANAKSPALGPAEVKVEPPVPLIRYVTARTCAPRSVGGSLSCTDTMSVVVR